MAAIVLNTLTGAVSEYSGFDFQSITPAHAGSTLGLYALGGNTDAGNPIAASILTGKTSLGGSIKKYVRMVYFSMRGAGNGVLTVRGQSGTWTYTFPVLSTRQSRCKPGMGIRENYLAFGYSNVGGADFQVDRIEVDINESKARRI